MPQRDALDTPPGAMLEITPQHRLIVDRLRRLLEPRRPVTISVDGRRRVGKSALARFLSWQLGAPLIETDLLLEEGAERASHDLPVILRLLVARYAQGGPVIVEGILVLRALADIGVCPDFSIYVDAERREAEHVLLAELERYETVFEPRQRADFRFHAM